MNIPSKFINRLKNLYAETFGYAPEDFDILPAAGSDRRYVRFYNAKAETVIGVYNPNKAENSTFLYLTQLFLKKKLPVPHIIDSSSDGECYFLEDLGKNTLFDLINSEGHIDKVKELLRNAIDQLVRFQWQTNDALDYSLCFDAQAFDQQQIFADLLYFKYYFADPLAIKYNKANLLDELNVWAKNLAAKEPKSFMYRDFQSRNILVKNKKLAFVDYQGGMLGLPEYDLASLLWQARAQYPEDWKEELLTYYFKALSNIRERPPIEETAFRKTYLECVLLRIMQTLGAYGFRGLLQGKNHFIKSITPALRQLQYFLNEYPQIPRYNELRKVLEALVRPDIIHQFSPLHFPKETIDTLNMKIYSFSYKVGLPQDHNEHGGGYVFDCRGILNPGRQEKYKNLTGKDKPVIDFLENETQMPGFLKGIFKVLDISVTNYLSRGFNYLSASFGCTGGQHRSVYAAEALARHLKEKFGLSSEVVHLEQEASKIARR